MVRKKWRVLLAGLGLSLIMTTGVWAASETPEENKNIVQENVTDPTVQDDTLATTPEPTESPEEGAPEETEEQTGEEIPEVSVTPEVSAEPTAEPSTTPTATPAPTPEVPEATEPGWQETEQGIRYFEADAAGTLKEVTGWQDIDGKTYYFDEEGYLQTGWKQMTKYAFYFEEEGALGEKGAMALGWKDIDGKTFYFKKTGAYEIKGALLTGIQNVGTKTYYFAKDGDLGTKGQMLTGWQDIDGKTYFLKRTGERGVKGMMLTGWQNIDSKRYYFKKTGERGVKGYMFKGVCNVSGEIYQFASDGHLVGEFTLAKPSISAWKKTGDSDWNPTGGDGVEYTVSWGKVSGATGYQICFSSRDIDEEMSGKAWHVDYITTKKLSYKVQFSDYPTHIKAKVRAYRKEGNTTIYSSWSSEVSKKCEWPEETSDPIDTFINSIKGNYYAVLPVGQDKENVIIVTSDPTKGGSKVTSSVFTPTTRGYDINLYTVDGNKVSWIGEKEGRISNGPWFIYKDKIAVYDAREGYHYLEISRDGYKDVHVKTLPKDLQSKSQTITLKRA